MELCPELPSGISLTPVDDIGKQGFDSENLEVLPVLDFAVGLEGRGLAGLAGLRRNVARETGVRFELRDDHP
jgi:hypothetical protein